MTMCVNIWTCPKKCASMQQKEVLTLNRQGTGRPGDQVRRTGNDRSAVQRNGSRRSEGQRNTGQRSERTVTKQRSNVESLQAHRRKMRTAQSPQGKKNQIFSIKMKKKLAVLFIIILLAFAGLAGRILYISHTDGENYKKQVLSQQEYNSKSLPYKRGEILDANGTKLAFSEKVYNLVVDSKEITSSKQENAMTETMNALRTYFEVDTTALSSYISEHTSSRYYVVKKTLTYEQVTPFQEAQKENKSIVGVWFEEEYRRKYPYNSLASTIIGFTGSDNNGTYGLEEYYNTMLNGTNGRQYGYLTEDSMLERTTIPAQDGDTLVTSIDANIQNVVEKYIKQFNDEHRGEYREGEDGSVNTGVIVMDPQNGEILAMADSHSFDLNNPKDLTAYYTDEEIAAMDEETKYEKLNQLWRNFCVSDTYEPGSVAKAMTIAAGLDAGKLTGNESYFCGGKMDVSGHTIKCHKRVGHGTVTVSQALEQSCNMALIQMAEQIGKDTLMKYLYNFNIGLKTNVDVSGEARTASLVYAPENMVASDLAISSFGQGYNVTMIQMASAFCSIINGGKYYEPHVVKEIRNANGTTVKKVEPRVLKQTISATTSDTMRQYLANVCTLGTGTTAVPAGYLIGGKTGTAETQPRGNRQYVVSFMGFAPVEDPQVVIYVVVDKPNVEDQPHSSFAQEIAKNILTEILPYMNVFRTEELTEEELAQLQQMHIIAVSENSIEEETEEDGIAEEEGGSASDNEDESTEKVTYTTDPETGYVIDPDSGEYLDPETYAPVDTSSSNLDGLIGIENKPQDENDFKAGAGF